MKSIDCIFRETLVDGSFKIKGHVLVFIDGEGNQCWKRFILKNVNKKNNVLN